MIKAIFFDIDGTLLSFQTHAVPDSTTKALAALHRRGVRTFIATGRPLGGIRNLDGLQFDGYITLNGGYCLTGGEDGRQQVIYKNPIDPQDIESLIRYERAHPFPVMFVTAREMFINYLNDTARQIFTLLDFPVPPVRPIEEAAEQEIFQVVSFFRAEEEGQIMREVFPHCDATRWNPLFADVVACGNSKRVGIDRIIGHYGIPLSETMAFGDGGNDIQMLQHVGIGVAMGNASDEVKRSARYVTDTVDDDGILNALHHFGIL